jgi:hypothetical protein
MATSRSLYLTLSLAKPAKAFRAVLTPYPACLMRSSLRRLARRGGTSMAGSDRFAMISCLGPQLKQRPCPQLQHRSRSLQAGQSYQPRAGHRRSSYVPSDPPEYDPMPQQRARPRHRALQVGEEVFQHRVKKGFCASVGHKYTVSASDIPAMANVGPCRTFLGRPISVRIVDVSAVTSSKIARKPEPYAA